MWCTMKQHFKWPFCVMLEPNCGKIKICSGSGSMLRTISLGRNDKFAFLVMKQSAWGLVLCDMVVPIPMKRSSRILNTAMRHISQINDKTHGLQERIPETSVHLGMVNDLRYSNLFAKQGGHQTRSF